MHASASVSAVRLGPEILHRQQLRPNGSQAGFGLHTTTIPGVAVAELHPSPYFRHGAKTQVRGSSHSESAVEVAPWLVGDYSNL